MKLKSSESFGEVAQQVAKVQIKILKAPTVIFATAGIEVPHAHIHVLPASPKLSRGEGGPMPKKSEGEYLPGIESAKKADGVFGRSSKTAGLLRAGL